MDQYTSAWFRLQEYKAIILGVGQYNRLCGSCKYYGLYKDNFAKTCTLPDHLHGACNRLRFPNGLDIDPGSRNYMKDKGI